MQLQPVLDTLEVHPALFAVSTDLRPLAFHRVGRVLEVDRLEVVLVRVAPRKAPRLMAQLPTNCLCVWTRVKWALVLPEALLRPVALLMADEVVEPLEGPHTRGTAVRL